ncbi:MAG: sulfite exporter TauE/SafE family protein [Planctomycetes bacterium]|jgi:hypothetical protein|nr:sulfite exporter TauE/SafE family protein [Planctomycetota bacterium]
MDFTLGAMIGLAALGLFSGVAGGLVGIGGGVIIIPALTVLYRVENSMLMKAVTFNTMLFTAASSAWKHHRSGLIVPRAVKLLVAPALAGLLAGYFSGRLLPEIVFQAVLGVFLLYVSGVNAWRLFRPPGESETLAACQALLVPGRASAIGAFMGFIAGVLGIGGGSIAGPCMQVFLKMPLKNAIACSSLAMIPLTAAAVGLSLWSGLAGDFSPSPWWTALAAAGFMIPGALAGGYLGAWLAKVLSDRWVRFSFAFLILVVAVRILWKVAGF